MGTYEEIGDGFDSKADFIACIKEYANILIKAACEPSKAGLASMFGVPPIIKYVETVLAGTQATGSAGVEMKQEGAKQVSKVESLQERYARLFAEDKKSVSQVRIKPLSRAYMSLDLGQNMATTDEQQKNQ